ncbi:MAG: glutamine--fructose-6-phosphate transaminase (isomerizing) [Lachnospiraceae bacterium]|nr:glutamine--fructose-6-phosphate transaminase (isomerizing) [Lachnospiraceae bacterium]
MCGIVGYVGKEQAAPVLLEGLKKLEYRGYDSAGIAVMNEAGIRIEKVSGRIAALSEKTNDGKALRGTLGIGHTRWATHGAPTDTNAHPHLSNDGRFAIVHNGIIENYAAIREELIREGYVFESETDTEVIVHLLEKYYDGDMKTTVRQVASRLTGSYALGILCSEYPDRIFAVRESSPLIIGIGVGENFFASDVTALVRHTKNVIYLEDGEFAVVSPEKAEIFDYTGKVLNKPVSRITWSVKAAEKGGYPHFMLKEIHEEPGAVKETITPRIRKGDVVLDDIDWTQEYVDSIDKILITACGSAYHAGCSGRFAIEELSRIPVSVELASELRYNNPIIDEKTLVIVISQSGETADTIAALKECKARGAKVLAIVNVVGSTVAKLADHVLYTWAGPEIAVATTKGFTTQIAMLYLIALYLGKARGKIGPKEFSELIAEFRQVPKLMQETIDMGYLLPELAEQLYEVPAIFYIGRNTDYAVALEGALKMKEISYIHSESYAAGELKHGTIALIDNGRPVIALCCNDRILDKMMSNVIEVKARGAKVIAVTFRDNEEAIAQSDECILIPRIRPIFAAILEILPLQMLAYYTAEKKGCDIDKPKNLAKSVTVE